MPKGKGYGKKKAVAGGGGMHRMGPARKTKTALDKAKKLGKGIVKEFGKNPRKAPPAGRRVAKI